MISCVSQVKLVIRDSVMYFVAEKVIVLMFCWYIYNNLLALYVLFQIIRDEKRVNPPPPSALHHLTPVYCVRPYFGLVYCVPFYKKNKLLFFSFLFT